MIAKTIPRPGVRTPTANANANGRGKRIHLSREILDEMRMIYPENMETMPDAAPQEPIIRYFKNALESHFRKAKKVAAVMGDLFIFYRAGDTQAKFAADMSVTLGVSAFDVIHDENYYSWLLGALPHLVLEAGSSSTARNDLGDKFRLYASLKIPEYWMMDVPIGKSYGFLFRGYRLVDGEYVEIEPEPNSPAGMVHYRSRVLGLDFCIPSGATQLYHPDIRLYDPETREYLRTHLEMEDARDAQYARAELERDLRIDAEYRAAAAAERIKELEKQLRERDDD